MKLISEYTLDKETIAHYVSKGFEVYYGYEDYKIRKGEAVGFLLDTMYKSTIEQIEYLLYTKHNLTLKYKDKSYKLNSLDEWKYSYREQGQVRYKKHDLLIEYECKRKDYLDKLELIKNREKQEEFLEQYNVEEIPMDLDAFVDTFSRLYKLDVDMSSEKDKIICYNQIKTYMDLDLTYLEDCISNAHTLEGQEFMYSNCVTPDETIFSGFKFKEVSNVDVVDIETYGDEVYLEDTIYKESSDVYETC